MCQREVFTIFIRIINIYQIISIIFFIIFNYVAYRLIISTILNAIGCRVEVEHMLATGRIDLIARTDEYTYIMELKLTNNGGIKAATDQILNKRYLEPFKADKRRVIGLAVELDSYGNGLIDWNVIQ